jgi:hypothetical protein
MANSSIPTPDDGRSSTHHLDMEPNREREPAIVVRSAADVMPDTVSWIIPARIPRGTLTMVVGRDGSAKTTFARWLAAAGTRGLLTGRPLRVHLALSEDDAARVTAPALHAAGADLNLVDLVTDGSWLFPRDLDRLDQSLAEQPVDVVVIDPLASAVVNLNHQKAGDALRALRQIAERHNAAVIVIHHTVKRAKDAGTAIAGSYNIRTACRSILFWEQLGPTGVAYVRSVTDQQGLELEEETGRLCMLWPYKASYARLSAPMVFEQRSRPNPADPETTVGVIELLAVLDEELDPSLALDPVGRDSGRERAKAAILVLLSRGPMTAEELEGAVITASGTSLRTFQRARRELSEEGTIERFQASRSGGSRLSSDRCHWWRLVVPSHVPS